MVLKHCVFKKLTFSSVRIPRYCIAFTSVVKIATLQKKHYNNNLL